MGGRKPGFFVYFFPGLVPGEVLSRRLRLGRRGGGGGGENWRSPEFGRICGDRREVPFVRIHTRYI